MCAFVLGCCRHNKADPIVKQQLEEAGARAQIHTVRGVGYALREPDE